MALIAAAAADGRTVSDLGRRVLVAWLEENGYLNSSFETNEQQKAPAHEPGRAERIEG
jgi:hypothetical protein